MSSGLVIQQVGHAKRADRSFPTYHHISTTMNSSILHNSREATNRCLRVMLHAQVRTAATCISLDSLHNGGWLATDSNVCLCVPGQVKTCNLCLLPMLSTCSTELIAKVHSFVSLSCHKLLQCFYSLLFGAEIHKYIHPSVKAAVGNLQESYQPTKPNYSPNTTHSTHSTALI